MASKILAKFFRYFSKKHSFRVIISILSFYLISKWWRMQMKSFYP